MQRPVPITLLISTPKFNTIEAIMKYVDLIDNSFKKQLKNVVQQLLRSLFHCEIFHTWEIFFSKNKNLKF